MTDQRKFGPVVVAVVAYKCYDKFIEYKGAAGFPEFSLYIPRNILPGDSYPYLIHVNLQSDGKTHWKLFAPNTIV